MSKLIIDQILEYHTTIPRANVAGPMTMEDLCIDSLDCVEICMDIEDKLKIVITDEELDAIKTVQDIYDIVDRKQASKNAVTQQQGESLGENIHNN